MSAHATIARMAREDIPYGSPVKGDRHSCAVTTDLDEMIGVAKRGGRGDDGYEAGEQVVIQTEGGILATLAADATVTVAGAARRLLRRDQNYLELRNGRIVG